MRKYTLDPIAYNDFPEIFPSRGPIAGTADQIVQILDGFRFRLVPPSCPDIWVTEFQAWAPNAGIGDKYYACSYTGCLMVIERTL